MAERRRKFWGWGFEDQQPPHGEVEQVGLGAREHLGFGPAEVERPARLEDLELPAPRIEPPAALAGICRSDVYERALHCYGSAYRDVVRAFRGRFDRPPDVVAHPADEGELEAVLDWCAHAGAAAIPFGGRTSVVGGVEPRVPQEAAVCIDLKRMNRVLEVDPVSRAARIEAGATGPELEQALRAHGLTLRHYPQSFEYSTLGGWIATRAGGHFAWDRFEEFVVAVREATVAALGGEGRMTCRLTHVYPDGAAPYFTVLAPARRGDELAQWDEVKAAASEAIAAAGGTITHHHAVGRDHRPWYDRQRPDFFALALRAAKAAVDPSGMLNPGVLIDP